MARRQVPPPRQPANLSIEQVRAAIPRLEKRRDEFKALNVDALNNDDYRNVLDDLCRRTNDTLRSVYGPDSIDYHEYEIGYLDTTPLVIGRGRVGIAQRRPGIRTGVGRAIAKLQSAITVLNERLEESGETAAARTITAYEGLDLHPEIAGAASQLYNDGHYANAVEAAVKALNGLVRLRSGLDIDGMSLMERAFGPSNPILKFNDLSDQSDRDEQKGFMMMFSGAVSGLRNPRSHKFIHDDPERALEFIAFVSLLAKLLDEAKK
jgi:uncharacterized protein (TIGR02391 family)